MSNNDMRKVADILIDDFDRSGAVNYRECNFEYDDGREFTLTLTLKSGKSQGEILKALSSQRDEFKDTLTALMDNNALPVVRELWRQRAIELIAKASKL